MSTFKRNSPTQYHHNRDCDLYHLLHPCQYYGLYHAVEQLVHVIQVRVMARPKNPQMDTFRKQMQILLPLSPQMNSVIHFGGNRILILTRVDRRDLCKILVLQHSAFLLPHGYSHRQLNRSLQFPRLLVHTQILIYVIVLIIVPYIFYLYIRNKYREFII